MRDIFAQVDAIVVCSSSRYLCEKIVDCAGPQVEDAYKRLASSDDFPNATVGGQLRCQRIFFIPWSPQSQKEDVVKASLIEFVSTAFAFAQSMEYKTIGK